MVGFFAYAVLLVAWSSLEYVVRKWMSLDRKIDVLEERIRALEEQAGWRIL